MESELLDGNVGLRLTCSPSRLHKFLNSGDLSDRKILLQNTLFRDFLDLPDVSMNSHLLMSLLSRWNAIEKGFNLGGKVVKFSLLDAALIFGLPTSEELMRVDLDKKSGNNLTESLEELLPTRNKEVERKEIDQIEDAIKQIDISIEDGKHKCMKLLVLHICATFLFPSKNGKVKRSLIPYVKDIENMDKYSWGSAALDFLFSSLSEAKLSLSNKRIYLPGCTYGLQVWAYEHISFGAMFESFYGRRFNGAVKMTDGCFPRINSWKKDMMTKSHYQEIFKKLTYDYVTLTLSVSDIEKEKDLVKNAHKENEDQDAELRESMQKVAKSDMEKQLNSQEECEVKHQPLSLREEYELSHQRLREEFEVSLQGRVEEIEVKDRHRKEEFQRLKEECGFRDRFLKEEFEAKYETLNKKFDVLEEKIGNSSTSGPSCHESESAPQHENPTILFTKKKENPTILSEAEEIRARDRTEELRRNLLAAFARHNIGR